MRQLALTRTTEYFRLRIPQIKGDVARVQVSFTPGATATFSGLDGDPSSTSGTLVQTLDTPTADDPSYTLDLDLESVAPEAEAAATTVIAFLVSVELFIYNRGSRNKGEAYVGFLDGWTLEGSDYFPVIRFRSVRTGRELK